MWGLLAHVSGGGGLLELLPPPGAVFPQVKLGRGKTQWPPPPNNLCLTWVVLTCWVTGYGFPRYGLGSPPWYPCHTHTHVCGTCTFYDRYPQPNHLVGHLKPALGLGPWWPRLVKCAIVVDLLFHIQWALLSATSQFLNPPSSNCSTESTL